MPKISVILPVFNGEKYIAEAIESILNQTFKDFELIVLDDGSSDRSLDVIQRYDNDSRLKIISRENKGLPYTLNEGIAQSASPWIARMDADDISMPNRLQVQLDVVEQSGIDIAGSNIRLFGRKNKVVIYPQNDIDIKGNMFFWRKIFPHPAVLINRKIFERMNYNEELRVGQDTDLWIRTSAIEGIKYCNIQEPLLLYRKHEEQATALQREKQKSQRISVMRNALIQHGMEFTDEELFLHHKSRIGEKFSNRHEVLLYKNFLRKLMDLFDKKFGDDRPVRAYLKRLSLRYFWIW